MQTFIVVLEYSGAFLLAGATASRAPVCEHAYDVGTGILAGHPAGDLPRVGFPVCQRGWNTPAQAARCPACDTAVQRVVQDLITAAVRSITSCRFRPAMDPRHRKAPPASGQGLHSFRRLMAASGVSLSDARRAAFPGQVRPTLPLCTRTDYAVPCTSGP